MPNRQAVDLIHASVAIMHNTYKLAVWFIQVKVHYTQFNSYYYTVQVLWVKWHCGGKQTTGWTSCYCASLLCGHWASGDVGDCYVGFVCKIDCMSLAVMQMQDTTQLDSLTLQNSFCVGQGPCVCMQVCDRRAWWRYTCDVKLLKQRWIFRTNLFSSDTAESRFRWNVFLNRIDPA